MSEVERVKNSFPDQFQKLLEFYEEGDYIIAKPKRYLVGEEFPMVAGIVKKLDGEYMSAGKLSHFRFKKEQRAQLTLLGHLKIAMTELEYIEKALRETEK